MSTQVQYRRGTSTQNNAFTGALAEITVDTTNLTLRVHDGITAGGSSLVGLTASQTLTNKIYQGTSVSVTGNVTGGNVTTAGVVSATGNVSGGNIAGTTGAFTTVTGNANATSLTSGTVPSARLSGSYTIDISGAATTAATVTTAAQPNITSVGTLTSVSVTGNVTCGNLITAGLVSLSSITKTGSNGVGNIGAAASTFNTVFAKATSAQYADVAERYQADCEYAPGTVLIIGGAQEVTASTVSHDHRAVGVVSENPSYLMNSALDTVNSVAVALLGRVPCQVVGPIDRGDLLTTSTVPGTAGRLDPAKYLPGCVIGKALQDYHSEQPGTIEIAVGVK